MTRSCAGNALDEASYPHRESLGLLGQGSNRQISEELFAGADIRVGGERRWDIAVRDERFFRRFIRDGALGLGESYMDGWWDCEAVDAFLFRLFRDDLVEMYSTLYWRIAVARIRARLLPDGRRSRSREVVDAHYDLDRSLFEITLDKSLAYTCGYWKESATLDQAQEAKYELICRKLQLAPGMTLLDVGCGWGGFARHAAERYGARVTGVCNSAEQIRYAQRVCTGLDVEFHERDYRDLSGRFDRITTIGMIEHVGPRFYRTFMKKVVACLNPDGLFLLHTIGNNNSRFESEFITTYIFPGGFVPSLQQIGVATEDLLVIEDLHNFGIDYDRTLMEWCQKFERNWDHASAKYDTRFKRMWKFYLLSSAAGFRARKTHAWQFVMSRGLPAGYRRPC